MTRNRIPWRFLCLLVGVWIFVSSLRASPTGATITYRRVFKGSTPEFIEIKISDQGACTFDIRQLDDDADPEVFEVGPSFRKQIQGLSGELNNFAIANLDIQKKIAN